MEVIKVWSKQKGSTGKLLTDNDILHNIKNSTYALFIYQAEIEKNTLTLCNTLPPHKAVQF